MDKKTVRLQMLEQRNQLTKEEVHLLSDRIAGQVTKSWLYSSFERICIYQAFRNEVSCNTIMKNAISDGKQVFVPVTDIKNKNIEFYPVSETTQWKQGPYGIPEPILDKHSEPLSDTAFILMPGLAFDHKKHRIGYGGGYYDIYLATHSDHVTAALCYSFQITDDILPFEEHDRLPDYIFTETSIF